MSGLDKPTKEELEASAKPPCTCLECADKYGDQSDMAADFEIMAKVIEAEDMLSTAMSELRIVRKTSVMLQSLYDAKCLEVETMKKEASRWRKNAKKSAACQDCMTALERPL